MWVFDKLREVGVSPLLDFIPYLRNMLTLGLVEAVRGRLIGPQNLGPNCLDLWNPNFTVCDCSRTVWVANGVIHAMDGVLMCMRSESAEKYGFTK